MAIQQKKAELERILSDAHLVDIDMSRWDKYISFWMLADHYRDWSQRCPMVVITFTGIRKLCFKFSTTLISSTPKTTNIQWVIYDSTIEDKEGLLHLEAHGHASSPVFDILFEDVSFREADSIFADSLQPGWNQPGSPFVRRSIEEIVNRFQNR